MTRGIDIENSNDEKKTRRILANRISALKSRQKKAQKVESLEAEVYKASIQVNESMHAAAEQHAKNHLLLNKAEELQAKALTAHEQLKRMNARNDRFKQELQRLQGQGNDAEKELATSRNSGGLLLSLGNPNALLIGSGSGGLALGGGPLTRVPSYGSWGRHQMGLQGSQVMNAPPSLPPSLPEGLLPSSNEIRTLLGISPEDSLILNHLALR